jgi:hypothetical protein
MGEVSFRPLVVLPPHGSFLRLKLPPTPGPRTSSPQTSASARAFGSPTPSPLRSVQPNADANHKETHAEDNERGSEGGGPKPGAQCSDRKQRAGNRKRHDDQEKEGILFQEGGPAHLTPGMHHGRVEGCASSTALPPQNPAGPAHVASPRIERRLSCPQFRLSCTTPAQALVVPSGERCLKSGDLMSAGTAVAQGVRWLLIGLTSVGVPLLLLGGWFYVYGPRIGHCPPCPPVGACPLGCYSAISPLGPELLLAGIAVLSVVVGTMIAGQIYWWLHPKPMP